MASRQPAQSGNLKTAHFWSRLEKALTAGKAAHPIAPATPEYRHACVFLLLYESAGEPWVLAIQKADNEGYPWRNQVALPGGHIDAKDASALDAAYRELKEELNIERCNVACVASLGCFPTINHTDIEVFAGFWNGSDPIHFDPAEIARVIHIRLEELVHLHLASGYDRFEPDIFSLTYPLKDQKAVIWGATARIFHHFLERVHPVY